MKMQQSDCLDQCTKQHVIEGGQGCVTVINKVLADAHWIWRGNLHTSHRCRKAFVRCCQVENTEKKMELPTGGGQRCKFRRSPTGLESDLLARVGTCGKEVA